MILKYFPLTGLIEDNESCGFGWWYDKQGCSCYRLYLDKLSWDKAQEACATLKASLAAITGPQDQMAIRGNDIDC